MKEKKGCADPLLWTENLIILVFIGCIFFLKIHAAILDYS